MKKPYLIILFTLLTAGLHAQTFNEWFKQKKTQIKYLTQQIAALGAYAVVLEKGYSIAENGLHAIGEFKNGEFLLHGDFFSYLKNISPAVAKYYRTPAILAMQAVIASESREIKQAAATSGQFTDAETAYVANVCNGIITGCSDDLDELMNVTKSNAFEMSDDERFKRIDRIYEETRNKYTFIQSFHGSISMLAFNRAHETSDTRHLQRLTGKK